MFDLDDSGTIDAFELVHVFNTLGQQISEDDARMLIDELDEDGDGELSEGEFAKYFQHVFDVEKQSIDTMIKNMFQIFDVNQDGEISKQEFAETLQKIGKNLTSDDIELVIQEIDTGTLN